MGQALYRSWRPKSFDEVVGQSHITETLKKAIKSGRVSHAYLFTGPRGVGKTSVARILAHQINQLPYKDDEPHLDIIEIDGASNRRIDEVRELRDKIHTAPMSAKYKVYIIDEVHMLTREAFNALLKTLEEPPAHAIFILATTEPHKLPETIISRTQRFEFKPISPKAAAKHLAIIAKREKIAFDDAALDMVAEHSGGSFRDSISLLDQLSAHDQLIDADLVRQSLGIPADKIIDSLVNAIAIGDSRAAISSLDELAEQGAGAAVTARLVAAKLRSKVATAATPAWLIQLLRSLVEVPASPQPDAALELAVLEATLATAPTQVTEPHVEPEPQPAPKQTKPVSTKPVSSTKASSGTFNDQVWEEILNQSKTKAASLYTALRLAVPEVDKGKLTLVFQFPLHQKKLSQAKNKEILGEIVEKVTGRNLAINPIVDKERYQTRAKKSEADLKTISNIFGSAQVLES